MATEIAQPGTERRPQANLPSIRPERLPYHPALQEKFNIGRSEWRALVEAVFPLAQSIDSVILALSYCKARRLDPFKRVVHIVPIWDSKQRCTVDTIWPGIGELRTTAMRTKEYAGRDKTEFGPDVTRRVGTLEITFPEWAQVTVYRMVNGQRVAFAGPQVYWLETYAERGGKDHDRTPNSMWAKRTRGQLDKCFDEHTEVLTTEGFQRFSEVTGLIMQVTDHGLEPTNAVPFAREYDGPMVTCDGNVLNFSVTPNHDMVTTNGKVEAAEVVAKSTSTGGFDIPLVIDGSGPDANFTDRQIMVAAALACDGYRHGGELCIAVSRKRKVQFLRQIGMHKSMHVRQCAGEDTVSSSGRVITTTANKMVFGYRRDVAGDLLIEGTKLLDSAQVVRLSRRQARLLVDSMLQCDGHESRTARRFFASSRSILAAFEVAACVAGYAISYRRVRKSDIGGKNYYVTVSTKTTARTMRASRSQSRLKGGLRHTLNESGIVWCCTVPTGQIVVRRKGLSMICGNCAEAAALRAAFPEEIGNEYIAEEAHAPSGSEARQVQSIVKVSGASATENLAQMMQGEAREESQVDQEAVGPHDPDVNADEPLESADVLEIISDPPADQTQSSQPQTDEPAAETKPARKPAKQQKTLTDAPPQTQSASPPPVDPREWAKYGSVGTDNPQRYCNRIKIAVGKAKTAEHLAILNEALNTACQVGDVTAEHADPVYAAIDAAHAGLEMESSQAAS